MRSLRLVSFALVTLFAATAAASTTSGSCDAAGFSAASQLGEVLQQVNPPKRATGVLVQRPDGMEWGRGIVYAIVDGKKEKVSIDGYGAWLFGDGRYVAISGADGAGGYENEGQSLRIYDVEAGAFLNGGEPVMREYVMIDDVRAVTAEDGRTALLVEMGDGGLGAPHLAVVNPERGQVFKANIARVLSAENGTLVVGTYRPEQIEDDPESLPSKTPDSTATYSLSELLDRPLVVNPIYP